MYILTVGRKREPTIVRIPCHLRKPHVYENENQGNLLLSGSD